MARAPDAKMEQAKELFLRGKKLIEISELLKIPEGTVRSWKNRYKWDNATLQTERNVAKRRGGQPGNKNAVGAGAPEKNKNAVTTGEFETLLFDCLDPEERQLTEATPEDKKRLLLQEIQLLSVRERRMLKRIELQRRTGDIELIQTIEDALTRVQANKQRAIETLHKIGYDDSRQELETMKLELAALKQGGPDTETADDGFIAALNGTAADLWSDGDGSD